MLKHDLKSQELLDLLAERVKVDQKQLDEKVRLYADGSVDFAFGSPSSGSGMSVYTNSVQ